MALRDTFCKGPAGGPRKRTPWLPETYTLESPTDIAALMQANTQATERDGRDPIWIYKPSCNNRGRGIKVVSGAEALKEICFGRDTGSPETSVPKSQGIVQKYIEAPLLVRRRGEGEGFKFDYRCYMLVARNMPSYVVFFHPGYCRLTLKPYSDAADSLCDATIHLTNAAVQKKDPLYEANKDFQIQSVEAVAQLVEHAGDAASAAFLRDGLDVQVKRCMVDILRASTPKLLRKCVPRPFPLLSRRFPTPHPAYPPPRLQLTLVGTASSTSLAWTLWSRPTGSCCCSRSTPTPHFR